MALQKITDSTVVASITGSENAFMQKEDDIVKVPISLLMDAIRFPVARASSGDGIAYAATNQSSGALLPTVSSANSDEQISAVGKGRQIVFIPWVKNQNDAPTLQLNGGEIIPIRIRAPKNQGTYDNAPTATLPVSAGALMRGVPYTLTFCGKYWLVDSQIAQFTQSDANLLTKYAKFWRGLTDGDSVTIPVVNTQDGVDGEIAAATVERTAEEVDAADGDVEIPTVAKVAEMLKNTASGKDGASAYELAVAQGYRGTLDEWLESLKGTDGLNGKDGADGSNYILTSADKAEIAELVDGATIVQAPIFVDSVDKMTDTSRVYVLSQTGEIWAYMDTTTTKEVTEKVEGTDDNPYLNGNRLGSDGSAVNDSSEIVLTPYIDIGQYEPYQTITLKLAGIQYIFPSHTTNVKVALYDENKGKIVCFESCIDGTYGIGGVIGFEIADDNSASVTLTLPYAYSGTTVKYMRFCTIGTSAESDISITYTGEVTGGQWVNTGTTYAPTLTAEDKSAIAAEVASLVDDELIGIIGSGAVTV